MSYNFQTIEKRGFGSPLPPRTIRFNGKRLSIDSETANRFSSKMKTETASNFLLVLSLMVDKDNRAIKVAEPASNGVASISLYSPSRDGSYGNVAPISMIRMGMPAGDYVEVEPYSNIFVLAH